MARSISRRAASGLFIAKDATKPGKRSGCRSKLQGMPNLEPIWGLDLTRLTFN